jgi:hypothetical protein
MHVGPAFITYPQTAEPMQPCDGLFDYPARSAQMAAMLPAPLADLRADTTLPQEDAITFAVIAPVGLNKFRLDQRMTASTGNLWHAIQQRHDVRGSAKGLSLWPCITMPYKGLSCLGIEKFCRRTKGYLLSTFPLSCHSKNCPYVVLRQNFLTHLYSPSRDAALFIFLPMAVQKVF